MDSRAVTNPSECARRRPPTAVKLLLPVWGYSHLRDFFELSLPTLLSPGNVPAVVQELPTEFVILTSADDEALIRDFPAFRQLAAICPCRLRPIDHLITDGNYSTTITLAYTEAVREVGDAMVDTCFFFLVSDYIMADGSLANVLRRMKQGADGVVTGNFQVAREDALPWLRQRLAAAGVPARLRARELMRWALGYLHPATLANTVNNPFSHNAHTNRLFWRVDANTIIGRFYLMHMLCVRPEITDFVIGSSCDYSFIPEMCPSGNVEAITDSDEYLVVELQPTRHEEAFLRPGPLEPRALARSLNEWTTAAHRQNVRHTLVFHADELPAQLGDSIREADAFVNGVSRLLRPRPVAHRGHPYWRGAMAAFYDATGRRLDQHEWRYALGLPATENRILTWLLWRAKYALLGRPPWVPPWHPNWPDLNAVLNELAPFLTDPAKRLLMLSNEPTAFTVSLSDSGERAHRMRCTQFLKTPSARFKPLNGKFDYCLLELHESEIAEAIALVDRVAPLMKDGGRILIFVLNRRAHDQDSEFAQSMVRWGARMFRAGASPTEYYFLTANFARRQARTGFSALRRLLLGAPWIGVPLSVLAGGFVIGISLVGNLFAWQTRTRRSLYGRKSSFLLRLTAEPPISSEVHSDSAVGAAPPAKHKTEMREPQYNDLLEVRDAIGLTSLGLMTNQIWYDDPRRMAFLLARYKFVAKMLRGCRDAGEVGCGDAFGSRIVMQEVPDLTVYDFDPVFIQDIMARQDKRWSLKAELHDILAGPLPRKHEAIFSLDVIEHIASDQEETYLRNLCSSLSDRGVLIIGTPSLESQSYASSQSRRGHVNCRSGNALKRLLENYFERVFLFSMNDEVVHTGFSPMAHYLLALCAQSKISAIETRS